jgi:hypothetical protein
MSNGDIIAAVVNWREVTYYNFKFSLNFIGLVPRLDDQIVVRDLYMKKDMLTLTDEDLLDLDNFAVDAISGHGIRIFKFSSSSKTPEPLDVDFEQDFT